MNGRFPRSARLRRSSEYEQLRRQGRRHAAGHFVVQVLIEETLPVRLGLTVSRKVGCAVVRNRLKRQLREFFRTRQHTYKSGLQLVISARSSAAGLSYSCLAHELDSLLAGYQFPVSRSCAP